MAAGRVMAPAAAAVIVLTLSGCSSSSGPSSGPSSAETSTSTSLPGSTEPTTPSPTQNAQAQVRAFIPTYLRMVDDLYLDPSRPLDDVYQVAIAPDATTEASAIGKFRAQGYRQTGRSRLVSAIAQRVDLAANSPISSSGRLSSVVVTACVDVSAVAAVDSSGKSVVPTGRPQYLVEQLTVVNAHFPDEASWRVSEAPNRQAQTCAG